MSEWLWVENPAYVNKLPRQLKADCHDGSPFVTIHCSCDFDNHVHESSIVEVPPDAGIVSKCHGCDRPLIFDPNFFQEAFAEMRERGWIK
jgi:hypothetical protein